ncbi:unannotated protein [freshwater metagenome]|uniref:Unannotated protein n=1 Tax=freshwater metagenome TaxID=449393 RepID=A0A6J7GG99_9ZZZZ
MVPGGRRRPGVPGRAVPQQLHRRLGDPGPVRAPAVPAARGQRGRGGEDVAALVDRRRRAHRPQQRPQDDGEHRGGRERRPGTAAQGQQGARDQHQQDAAEDQGGTGVVPVRQHHRPGPRRGGDQAGGQHPAAGGASPPQLGAADGDQGGGGRGQLDGVVAVLDALHHAEDAGGDHQPAAPQQQGTAHPVGAGDARGEQQSGDQRRHRQRQVPARLVPAGPQQPPDARRALVQPAAAGGLVPVQPAQPVVAERQAQRAVVGGAAHPRPVGPRHQGDGQHPPAGRADQRGPGRHQLADPAPQPGRPGDQVGPGQTGQHEERLQRLGQEGQADERAGQQQPAGAAVLDRPAHRPRGQHAQQGEQRIGVVVAEHQRRHRGDGQQRAGQHARPGAQHAAHGRRQHRDRQHPHQRLGQQHRPAGQAEQPDRQAHHPQRGRGLVHGDRARCVRGAEEPGRPARGAGLCGTGVEGVSPAGPGQRHGVQPRRPGEQRGQGHLVRTRTAARAGRVGSSRGGGRGRGVQQGHGCGSCGRWLATSSAPAVDLPPVHRPGGVQPAHS